MMYIQTYIDCHYVNLSIDFNMFQKFQFHISKSCILDHILKIVNTEPTNNCKGYACKSYAFGSWGVCLVNTHFYLEANV